MITDTPCIVTHNAYAQVVSYSSPANFVHMPSIPANKLQGLEATQVFNPILAVASSVKGWV